MILLRKGSSGSYVATVQLALTRAGENPGPTDGIFGEQTWQAVLSFQKKEKLPQTGFVGQSTFQALRPFLVGYTTHTLQSGDTVFKLARQYNSSEALIENANPNLKSADLTIGQKIIIPYSFSPVTTAIPYNALLCELICDGLVARYPFLKLQTVGQSVLGRVLPAISMGRGPTAVLVPAAHHANEWITCPIALKFLEEYATAVVNAGELYGQNAEFLFNRVKFTLIPLVNPDGVDLVTGALQGKNYEYTKTLAENYPQIPFPSGWKANFHGVDLNLNYPALWERARDLKFAAGFTKPGPRDFVGEKPLSEPESSAVFAFTQNGNFSSVAALHTQGKVIYSGFNKTEPPGAALLAQKMALASGYKVEAAPESSGYAGFKDWFVLSFERPGFTVEAGLGKNPLPLRRFAEIYPPVAALLTALLEGTADLHAKSKP